MPQSSLGHEGTPVKACVALHAPGDYLGYRSAVGGVARVALTVVQNLPALEVRAEFAWVGPLRGWLLAFFSDVNDRQHNSTGPHSAADSWKQIALQVVADHN